MGCPAAAAGGGGRESRTRPAPARAHAFPFLTQGRPRVAVVGGAGEGERPGARPDSRSSPGVGTHSLTSSTAIGAPEAFSPSTHTQNTTTWTCGTISPNHKEK